MPRAYYWVLFPRIGGYGETQRRIEAGEPPLGHDAVPIVEYLHLYGGEPHVWADMDQEIPAHWCLWGPRIEEPEVER